MLYKRTVSRYPVNASRDSKRYAMRSGFHRVETSHKVDLFLLSVWSATDRTKVEEMGERERERAEVTYLPTITGIGPY